MNKDILTYKPSSTEVLIESLRILSRDIKSEDGVANAAIAEAAQRMSDVVTLACESYDFVYTFRPESKKEEDWKNNWLDRAKQYGIHR